MLEIIKRTYNYLRVRSAVKTATRLNSQTGKRYYILQIHGKLRVLTRIQVDYLVSVGVLHRRMHQDYYLRKYSLTVIE